MLDSLDIKAIPPPAPSRKISKLQQLRRELQPLLSPELLLFGQKLNSVYIRNNSPLLEGANRLLKANRLTTVDAAFGKRVLKHTL